MNTTTRRKAGGLLAVLAVVMVPVMGFAGIPLLTMKSRHYVDTGASSSSLHLHPALIIAAIVFVIGIALVLYPRRDRDARP